VRANPVQFAVVREDPDVEAALVRRGGVQHALLIASGGCTALTLKSLSPALRLTLLDANPAQLALVRRKVDALARASAEERAELFNVGRDDPRGLNGCGNFESLFRGLRGFLDEFVIERSDLLTRLEAGAPPEAWADVFAHAYWPVAFELYFSDALLNAMFGRAATQHAPPGSYPRYFREAIERGLQRPDARRNYFLHHILLGHYLDAPDAQPRYLAHPPHAVDLEYLERPIAQLTDVSRFDLVSLSNLFDWMSEAEAAEVARQLARGMKRGAWLVLRQLNHATDFQRLFAPEFAFDDAWASELLTADRSLFSSRLNIGAKQ